MSGHRAALARVARAIVPRTLWRGARRVAAAARATRHFGLSRYCPVCESHLRRFLPHGRPQRAEALCPVCGSLERHRLAWMWFAERSDLLRRTAGRMLHLAPELALGRRLAALPGLRYVSGDLSRAAMVRLDLTTLPFVGGSFDWVYCSHVLEHVPDDRAAMAEIRRVLRPAGEALILVPIRGGTTVEGPALPAAERARAFGQEDHVRSYGRDIVERLGEVGLAARIEVPSRELAAARARLLGLRPGEEVVVCRGRPASR